MGRSSFMSLGLLVVFLSVSGAEVFCPTDWWKRGTLCYRAFKERVTWRRAEGFCLLHKPTCHLVSIHNATESADFANYLSDNFQNLGGVWIGLNDPMKRRRWEWIDGSNIRYDAWMQGEPNNENEDEFCGELVEQTGYTKWNDYNCDSLNAFMCQCRF